MLLFVLIYITQALSLKNYEFREGSDAYINSSMEMEYPVIVCDMYNLNAGQPFYTNKGINPTALLPEQQGRFNAKQTQSGSKFTMQLIIQTIQKIDEGVYILIVQEMNGEEREHIFDANIKVILPGLAKCTVVYSDYAAKSNQVQCQAAVGSDDTDSVMCYQNSEKALLYGPITRSDTHVTAVFWMYIDLRIFCCTTHRDLPINQGSCSDFTYPPRVYSTTPSPKFTQINISTTPSNRAAPGKNEESPDSNIIYVSSTSSLDIVDICMLTIISLTLVTFSLLMYKMYKKILGKLTKNSKTVKYRNEGTPPRTDSHDENVTIENEQTKALTHNSEEE